MRNLLYAISFLLSFNAWAVAIPITNYSQVTPSISRGARPSDAGLKALAQSGVKTVLNIDNDAQSIAHERKVAAQLGLRFISIPLSGFFAPSDAQTAAVQAKLNDPSLYPIFLHCKHGEDRTGLMVGLYRVYSQSWSPEDAYEEMIDKGFHKILIFLHHYYEETTGFED
jgi:protein tyrosine/serine phosphatase